MARKIKDLTGQDVEDDEDKKPGMTPAEIKKFKNEYLTLKQKHADAGSPLQTLFKKIEEKGEDRAAFKDACAISDMEPMKAQAYYRALQQYLEIFGFFDQGDLVDEAEGRDLKNAGKKKAA